MTHTPRTRTTEVCRGLGALLLFTALLAGFPVGLYTVAGSPIPDELPTWNQVTAMLMQPDTDHRLFLGVIRLIGWIAWVLFIASTCAEAISYLAGRTTPSFPRPVRPMQALVRDLVATATLTFSTAAAFAAPASAAVHVTTDSPSTVPEQPTPQHSPVADGTEWDPLLGDETSPSPEPELQTWKTRIVHRGDTLWSLARRTYGSGDHYPKIFKASHNLDQPDGVPNLTDPDDLHPGQHIRLPKPRTTPAAPSPARRAPSTSTEQPSAPENDQEGEARPPARPRPTSDGVKPSQVPSPSVAPPADQTPPAKQAASPAPATLTTTDEDQPSSFITLPSGSRIGLGLAAALSVAVAATRLHRRRRRPLGAEASQDLQANEPDEPSVPVAKARKTHLDTAYADQGTPIPSDTDLATHDRPATPPTEITVGTRDGRPVVLPLFGLSLGLSGHGALSAARAFVTEFLAAAHRDRAELLIPAPDAQNLFPHIDPTGKAALPPGLTVVPTLKAAITQMEAEILRRARLLEDADQTELSALRELDPTEPLPALLLTASVPDQAAHTLDAVLALGRRYGIGALVLSPWQIGTSLHLSDDATVINAEGPHADALAGARLFHLTATDTTGMLHTLSTAAGAPTTKPSPSPCTDTDTENSARKNPTAPVLVPPPPVPGEDQPRPVQLQLLGPVRIHTADGPVTTGVRRSARDLLTYLGLHPGGITRDQAIGALWPDHEPDTATNAFNTAIANIRKVLRTATGLREPMFVINTTGQYRIDPALIDIDLWRLTTALTDARDTTTDSDRITALEPVADLYTADFATDLTYEWAEAHREYLRHTVIDALARLARLLEPDHPEQTLTILERAISHDPYAEALYRSVMQLQAQLGHIDAAKRTYRLLASRLDDLDTEPDDQTHKLLTNLQRPHNT